MSSVAAGRELNTEDISGCDWEALLKEARQQAVLLPLTDALPALGESVPEEIRELCAQSALGMVARNTKVEHAQRQLVKLLENAGLDYVILKGEASASYYPRPELRQLGDVDFLVPSGHREQATRLLMEAGYERSLENHGHHQVFQKPGAHLEMHSRLAGMPEGVLGEKIQAYLDRHFPLGVQGAFRAPAPQLHGLVLVLHMQHHMLSEGIGLRHLMDWGCFVQKTAREPFWQQELLPLLKELGLLVYACAMTGTAALYLGTACPDWADADEELCRDIIEDILAGGNFGGKNYARARSGNMLQKQGHKKSGSRVRHLYETLHRSVLQQHPELKDKKALIPFHRGDRAARYTVLHLKGERPSLIKAAAYAKERAPVYERLQIFETEE